MVISWTQSCLLLVLACLPSARPLLQHQFPLINVEDRSLSFWAPFDTDYLHNMNGNQQEEKEEHMHTVQNSEK